MAVKLEIWIKNSNNSEDEQITDLSILGARIAEDNAFLGDLDYTVSED